MKRLAVCLVPLLALAASAGADLVNPATLKVQETEPSLFTVELTLPVIRGRVVKARPILPDVCTVEDEPEVRGDAFKAIRTWSMHCDPEALVGTPVGIEGLLGTALDVQLTIETLDGRQHAQQLRPTQGYFVVPPPPTFLELAWSAGRQGAEKVVRRPEIALLLLLFVFSGTRPRRLLSAVIAFAAAQGVGQWLAGQQLMVMSLFIPQLLAAAAAWIVGVEILGRRLLRPGWLRPLPISMLILGLLYGAAQPQTVQSMGLSTREQSLSFTLSAVGAAAGLLLLALSAQQLFLAVAALPKEALKRWTSSIAYLSVALAGAAFFYRLTGPYFTGGIEPVVPLVSLVCAGALGLWLARDPRLNASSLAAIAAVLVTAGLTSSFHVALPLASPIVYGSLALIGARLAATKSWPGWFDSALVIVASLYQGHHVGRILLQETNRPTAHAAGGVVLLVTAFVVVHRGVSTGGSTERTPRRLAGLVVLCLALLWQLGEIRAWLTGPVATDLAMGIAHLPVLALLLLLAAFVTWPRRRRFSRAPQTGPSTRHWALLGLALFVLPLGTLRVDIPFHSPDAPSSTQAGRVLDSLLTDTYMAFNLPDENAAFDRLAQSLAQELVPYVYLDSRRRLTAGTREGAEVTVRDVSVSEVAEAINTGDNAFTYPCQWVVTARVRHLQHIHNRQNVYVGELTLRIEDDRWKIAALDLQSEERKVVSWRSS